MSSNNPLKIKLPKNYLLINQIKYKQKKVNTYTLNSLTCIEAAAAGNGDWLLGWHIKLARFRSQLEASSYTDKLGYNGSLSMNDNIHIYIYIYI